MNKLDLSKIAKDIRIGVSKHSPEILMAMGITAGISTVVLAVGVTPKAIRLIADEEANKGEELTKAEVIKTTWKCYIPVAATGIFSVACLIGSNSVNAKRNAALATAYQLSATALSDYKEKVIETIGEKKEKTVQDKVAQKKVEENPVSKSEVIITNTGRTLCFDAATGRYFESDIEKINRAVNEINREMTYNMYASLNEFYSELGIPHIELGDELGWNMDEGLLNVQFSSQIADDGRPCIVMNYNVAPRYDYSKLM